jgi:type I site-specific restriction-modification system R (restriction) subunit
LGVLLQSTGRTKKAESAYRQALAIREKLAAEHLQGLLKGVFDKCYLLKLLRDFVVFEDGSGKLDKKVAGYHQFHAVRVAVAETLPAAKEVLKP